MFDQDKCHKTVAFVACLGIQSRISKNVANESKTKKSLKFLISIAQILFLENTKNKNKKKKGRYFMNSSLGAFFFDFGGTMFYRALYSTRACRDCVSLLRSSFQQLCWNDVLQSRLFRNVCITDIVCVCTSMFHFFSCQGTSPASPRAPLFPPG